jgi:two-component system OmpR family response regulator
MLRASLPPVTATIACALEIPHLAEAASARGLRLVPFERNVEAQAALLAGDGDCAAQLSWARAHGWHGPLMLVLPEDGCVIRALDAGADDAVIAPANAGEIAARLAARLRRAAPPLVAGPLRIDTIERRVTREGRAIPLVAREYALLLHLVRNAERPIGRAELLAAIWGLEFDPGTNVVEVHVSRLRAKLDRGFATPLLITERGRGYRLVSGTGYR